MREVKEVNEHIIYLTPEMRVLNASTDPLRGVHTYAVSASLDIVIDECPPPAPYSANATYNAVCVSDSRCK